MCNLQRVDSPTLIPAQSEKMTGPSQETNRQPVFSEQELKKYFIVDSNERPAKLPKEVNLISFERLKNILNTIEQSPAGRNILIVLKNLLGDNHKEKQICFLNLDALFNAKNEVCTLYKNEYNNDDQTFRNAFDGNACHKSFIKMMEVIINPHPKPMDWKSFLMSEVLLSDFKNIEEIRSFLESKKLISSDDIEAIKTKYDARKENYGFSIPLTECNGCYCININEEIPTLERFVFDGKEIVAKNLEEMLGSKKAAEAYIIAHELVHLISFITFEKDSNSNTTTDTWSIRKDNWDNFFNTLKMQPIYNALKEKYSEDTIRKAFKVLFENVEEARNLLGFVPENRLDLPAVGEFFLFNEQEKFLLPTYLTEVRELTNIEKDVLKTIANAKGFEISLQNGSMTDEEKKCLKYSSNNFRSYIDIEEKMMDDIQAGVLSTKPQNITKKVLSGYQLVNVSGSNNNCGVRALLTAINRADTANEETIKQQRQNALQTFDAYIATHTDHNKSQQTIEQTRNRIENSGQMLTTEDFQWFASSLNRPIAIVVQRPNGEISYRHFSNTGDITDPNGIPNQDAFLNLIGQQPNTIVIYHSGIHFQALVPNS